MEAPRATPPFVLLKLFIPSDDPLLRAEYTTKIAAHNHMVATNPAPDAGFDLFIPGATATTIPPRATTLLQLGIKTAMYQVHDDHKTPLSFFMYPRSSMGAKTRLRLANSVGIIDSGYRGPLAAATDNTDSTLPHEVAAYSRLFQLCAPNLQPFYVTLVDEEADLGTTSRGSAGFGSTGK